MLFAAWITPENDARILHLHREDFSSSEIAAEMGLTKGKIIGRLHRLQGRVFASNGAPKLKVEKRGPGRSEVKRTLELPAAPPVPPAPVVRPKPVSRPCLWPMWGAERAPRPPIFCGAAGEPGRPYCPHHCALAYVRRAEFADAA